MSLTSTLLKTWRETFDPEVGARLERASQGKALEALPLNKRERSAALVKLATEASDDERSAALQALEAFARDASGALVLPIVEAWAEVEPDPRVARMALRTLMRLDHQLSEKVWRRLVRCIERHGDLGVVKDAQPYLASLSGSGTWAALFEKTLRKVETTRAGKPLGKLTTEVGSTRKTASTVDERSLLEAIAASPDDDAPRAVYADWLTEQGSARGEFISIQLMRGEAQQEREQQLLAAHREALLAEFDGVVDTKTAKFERGFVTKATVLTALPVSPLTKLLRSVTFMRRVGTNVELPALEKARVVDAELIPLRRAAPGLKRVEIDMENSGVTEIFDAPWVESMKLTQRGVKDTTPAPDELIRQLVESPLGGALRTLRMKLQVRRLVFLKMKLPSNLETFAFEGLSGSLELRGQVLNVRIGRYWFEDFVETLLSFVAATSISPEITIATGEDVRGRIEPVVTKQFGSVKWIDQ